MLPIKIANLVLRDFRASDVGEYQKVRDDSKFQRFYSEEDSSLEKSGQLIRAFIDQSHDTPRTKFQFAITLDSGTLIGSCGIRLEGSGTASIGCEVGRHWHGSGAAREAGLAIIEFGFRDLGVTSIYAETISENIAAIRLCRTLGMRQTHVRDNDRSFKGRTWSTAVLELSRSVWRETHAGT